MKTAKNRPVVLVTRPVPEVGLSILRQGGAQVVLRAEDSPIPREEFLGRLRGGVDGVVAMLSERVDAEALQAAGPRLRCVANFAVGHDNLDLPAMERAGAWATNTPDVLTEATADTAWALLMAAGRRIAETDGIARSGAWKGWGPLQFLGADFAGKTLGIVGAGRIGMAAARRSLGFRMRVLYLNSRGEASPEFEREVPGARPAPLEEILRESDFVSLHCPLTPATRRLISRERLALMKPSAVLANTARGPVVDEEALADALESGKLAAAGLDVHEREPEINPRLAKLPNATLLPHIGSATRETRDAMATLAAENLLAALRGERPPNALNNPRAKK